MNDNELRISGVLSNGLRYVVSRDLSSKVSYIGVIADAGSCDDPLGFNGMAHFVEHTIFKGTGKRSRWQISDRMESVGGELNAYTAREETVIYANSPAGYESRAFELLSDIIKDSRFPKTEVEREKSVVIEEINTYLDSPCDAVYDDFDDRLYAGSPIGHNILGTKESVKGITSTELRDFIDVFYTSRNLVVYCTSPAEPSRMVRLIEKYFADVREGEKHPERVVAPVNPVFDETVDDDNNLAHVVYGARTFGRSDDRRFALLLLNNIIGGPNMNAILNQELREKRGLVYTVDSNVALLGANGAFTVYFGCDPRLVGRCTRLVKSALEKLQNSPIKPRVFEKMRQQYVGQLMLSADNRESMAMAMGKTLFYYGECRSVDWTREQILSVTAEQVREMACLLAPDRCSRLILR